VIACSASPAATPHALSVAKERNASPTVEPRRRFRYSHLNTYRDYRPGGVEIGWNPQGRFRQLLRVRRLAPAKLRGCSRAVGARVPDLASYLCRAASRRRPRHVLPEGVGIEASRPRAKCVDLTVRRILARSTLGSAVGARTTRGVSVLY
jgi:hypothetical protein